MRFVNQIRYAGDERYCPVCESSSRIFLKAGLQQREDALCPLCHSVERHRLVMLFLQRRLNFFDGIAKKFLHVAPEWCLVRPLAQASGAGYLTADLLANDVMEKMDITDIKHPNNSFDAIYCSHVLEHVPNDRQAMREFYRVLKADGWAILNVPITVEKTFEDPTIVDPAERLRLFGQEDHVRRYGPDYEERLSEAGFLVTRYEPGDVVEAYEIERFGLSYGAACSLYYCKKPL